MKPHGAMGALALAMALATACSGAEQRRIGVAAPDESERGFGITVGDYLSRRCGTLDCHGQTGRNLRVWGCYGMRLDPYHVTSCDRSPGAVPTTAAEHLATYRSLVGLEPSVMSAVVQGHGQHPELLTFVRKARGSEAHKGGQIVTLGDDQDRCMTSWLAGDADVVACGNAIGYPIFLTDASAE